jgi:N-acetylglucosaminyl-diphospho-decaprenol L-rhamnosyltransferase
VADEVELSVVLVNHNGADCLPQALAALARNTASGSVECIVVDSGSSDDSWRDLTTVWDKARVLRLEENVGFCVGCNRGTEAAQGRLVAFVNFDSEVELDWDLPLRRLLDDPTISVATGAVLTRDGETIEAAGLEIAPNAAAYGRQELLPRAALPAGPVDVSAATGALMMVRRADFLELGGFYERLFMYGEDTDYCLRVPGRIVLEPTSVLRHEHGHAAGPARSRLRLYWGTRNRLLIAARHLPAIALLKSVLASVAFDALTLLQVRNGGALRAVARGWRDGLRLMPGERRARIPGARREAARRLVSLRQAIAQQRRLGRL